MKLRAQPQVEPVGPDDLKEGALFASWYIINRLSEELDKAVRYGRPLSVVIAKPKLFLGEQPESESIAAASEAARAAVRSTDLIGWLGEDRLLIILPEAKENEANAAASRWGQEMEGRNRGRGGQQWQFRVLEAGQPWSAKDLLQEIAKEAGGQLPQPEGQPSGTSKPKAKAEPQAKASPKPQRESTPPNQTDGRSTDARYKLNGIALIAASIASIVTFVGALLMAPLLLILLALIPPLSIAASLAIQARRPASRPEFLAQAIRQADTGRRLVIYERETGLFAHWYVELRCDEEWERAQRYDWPLTLLVVEPKPGSDAPAVQLELSGWLLRNLRGSDVAGYFGNGRFAVLMPQTDSDAAGLVVARLREAVRDIEVGLSNPPADGNNLQELTLAASQRLHESEAAA
jgi:GGDEF domain-containing protein